MTLTTLVVRKELIQLRLPSGHARLPITLRGAVSQRLAEGDYWSGGRCRPPGRHTGQRGRRLANPSIPGACCCRGKAPRRIIETKKPDPRCLRREPGPDGSFARILPAAIMFTLVNNLGQADFRPGLPRRPAWATPGQAGRYRRGAPPQAHFPGVEKHQKPANSSTFRLMTLLPAR